MLRFPPRRVLVAVEPSRASLFAWEAAKEISARFGASLEAVWCVEPVAAGAARIVGVARSPRFRDAGLKRLRARLGPGSRLHAVAGRAAPAILRLARDRSYDLVVLGTHRRSGLLRWFEGSVAEAVIRGAPCPVLVVPRAWRAPSSILAPVHEAGYARRGLLSAAVLARAYGGRLAMLEVVPDAEGKPTSERRLSALAGSLPVSMFRHGPPEVEVRVGDPAGQILRAARDMVVLVSRRKSLLRDAVQGTTVERVLRRSRCPVLAIPLR